MTKTPRRRTPPAAPLIPPKLAWYTEEWNRLAPEAIKLGLRVKVHTSPFESRAAGERRLSWLLAEMKKAARKRGKK